MTNCGATRENCCTSLEVTGGTYYRTYDAAYDAGVYAGAVLAADGGPTGEADPATVSTFRLDKYEVIVGRFRQFVNAWAAGWLPTVGSGKHSHLSGGLGLANSASAGTYETGWVTTDNSNVSPTNANLNCAATLSNWTPSVGSNENLPINCVNSYEALAFCIWDGGFLPSEAEWGYAAGGGNQQREYPWGSIEPGMGYQYAIYDCYYPSGSGPCASVPSLVPAPVGTATAGSGLWAQLDLAGSVAEWNLDWFFGYVDPCVDCAYLTPKVGRVFRGGDLASSAADLLVPHPLPINPGDRTYYLGFRCARPP
jgi:formylglycine-generating enzyme required for sulfatase activity